MVLTWKNDMQLAVKWCSGHHVAEPDNAGIMISHDSSLTRGLCVTEKGKMQTVDLALITVIFEDKEIEKTENKDDKNTTSGKTDKGKSSK